MSMFLASIDSGNGGTNAIGLKAGAKKTKRIYFPSVRAAATGDSLGLGSAFEMQYELVYWNGHTYVVGDDVVRITKRGLERHMGASRYGDEFHRFLVAVALAKLGVKDGNVGLTLFAPPGLFKKARVMIEERFLEGDAQAKIKLRGDNEERIWKYEKITVWPEGIGAAATLILNDKGELNNPEALTGQTVILDIGAYTADAVQMVDGNFNPEMLSTATWENAGVETHIRQPILREIHSINEDFTVLTVDDIDVAIRKGLTENNYSMESGGYEIDIEPLLNKQRERYAEWVANNICDGVFNGFRGIKGVILVGGGSVLIADHLQQWYGDKIIELGKQANTKGIHPVDMNAVGGLRLALMQQNQ